MTPTFMIGMKGQTVVPFFEMDILQKNKVWGLEVDREFCFEHAEFKTASSIQMDILSKQLDI